MPKVKPNEKTFENDEAYYADKEFISFSMLKDFLFCEYLFQAKHVDKTFVPLDEERDYFIYGRAVDTLLTEKPEVFADRFLPVDRIVSTEGLENVQREIQDVNEEIKEKITAGKPYKTLETKLEKLKERENLLKDASGKTQITATTYKHVLQSVAELESQPLYQKFQVKGHSQEIIALTINGFKRKGKLDFVDPAKKIIKDIKTTGSMERFDPRAYCAQLAYYGVLAEAKYGIKFEDWEYYLSVVDKNSQYKRSEIYTIDLPLLRTAKVENEALLKQLKTRIDSGFYKPVTDDPIYGDVNRREKCFKCDHYRNCPFAKQKRIAHITS